MINQYENENKTFSAADVLSNEDVISTLNGLIETCKDGQEGFKQAAEGVLDDDLKSSFYNLGNQRAEFVGELQSLVRELGGNPEKSGTILGSLRRGWLDIKAVVSGNDKQVVLDEAEHGEDIAVKNYQDALDKNLPAYIRTIVERQYYSVKATHDRVKLMRNFAHNATKSGGNY